MSAIQLENLVAAPYLAHLGVHGHLTLLGLVGVGGQLPLFPLHSAASWHGPLGSLHCLNTHVDWL